MLVIATEASPAHVLCSSALKASLFVCCVSRRYDYFHDDCPLVEVDKSKRNAYKRKIVNVAGKIRRLTCQRRVMTGTKKQLTEAFFKSDVFLDWERYRSVTVCVRALLPVDVCSAIPFGMNEHTQATANICALSLTHAHSHTHAHTHAHTHTHTHTNSHTNSHTDGLD